MSEMDLSVVLLAVGYVGVCAADDGKSKWTYQDEEHWSSQCREGKRQSPINIESHTAVRDFKGKVIRGPLQFRRYSAVALEGLNNGHTVKFMVKEDEEEPPTLSGGPLRHVYQLDQLHFHWLGEHEIDGIKYPLEIHFVHHRRGLSVDEALRERDGVVVLAVLCLLTPGQADRFALQQITDVVPELVNESSHATPDKADLLRFLGSDRDSYYTYEGSLTTPECREVVTWIVFDKPIRITDQQYKEFSAVHVGGISNFRSVQPLSGRVVYRTPHAASGASGVAARPSLVTAVATAAAGALTAASGAIGVFAALVNKAVDALLKIKRYVYGVQVAGAYRDHNFRRIRSRLF